LETPSSQLILSLFLLFTKSFAFIKKKRMKNKNKFNSFCGSTSRFPNYTGGPLSHYFLKNENEK